MVINKNDELVEVMRELVKGARTPRCSTIITKTIFNKEANVIIFYFPENIQYFVWKNAGVDFDCTVEGSFFITAILSEFEKKDKVELTLKDSKVFVNDTYKFESNQRQTGVPRCTTSANIISFTQEQFDNLKKDSVYTVGNFFLNSKTTDVIGFANYQGELYKLLPGVSAYKIEKFDALIDKTNLSQRYGHSIYIWLMPLRLVELTKGSKIEIDFDDSYIYIYTDKMAISYNCVDFGLTEFKNRVAKFGIVPNDTFFPISALKDLNLDDFINNFFHEEEDKIASIIIKDNIATITIDNCEFKVPVQAKDYEIYTNVAVLNFLKNLQSDFMIGEVESMSGNYILTDGISIIFIPKTKFID